MTATRSVMDAYPLAALQAGMLYHAEFRKRTAAFNDVLTLTLEGRFDLTALRGTLADLVARHPVLRTSFDLTGFSEPVQLVHATATVPVTVFEVPSADSVRRWRADEQFRPHNLGVAPLLRATVHKLPGDFTLSLSFHHAILDGWSVASLVTELLRRYAARLVGSPLPVVPPADTFRDFVAAERRALADPLTSTYWRAVVEGAPASQIPLLPGHPGNGPLVSDRHVLEFDAALQEKLATTAAALGVPVRSLLLAVHLRVLGLVAGDREAVTGVVTHGRPETEGGAEVAGLFLNTVPLRAQVDHPTWAALVSEVDIAMTTLLPHRRLPLFEIQRLAGRSPLFGTAFDFHDFHVYEEMHASAVRLVRQDHAETTDIPFTAVFARGGGEAGLTLSYHRNRFPAGQIATIGDLYLTALTAVTDNPRNDPRRTALRQDLAQITRWNGTGVTAPEAETLHGMVAHWAITTPDRDALLDGETRLTFRELWHRVTTLADRLTTAGVTRETVVAVGIPRSADALVAVLAVLQAGGAALPLDLTHPILRLQEIVADAGATVLVTTDAVHARFADLTVVIDHPTNPPPDTPSPPLPAHPDELAAVLFTSGSTGRPKGVLLTHQAITQFCAWHGRHIGLTAGDRMAQRSPLSVDGTFIELAMAYAVGAAVVVVPTEAVIDPDTFADVCTRHRISVAYLVPSLLTPLVEAGAIGRAHQLRQVVSGGETLPRAVVEAFGAQSDAELHNIYGPTELGVAASEWPTDPGHPDAPVPIGSPGPGTTLHVLDDAGEPAPIGTPGEVYAGGPQLARGYLGKPGLTADRFVPDHLSGRPGARLYRTGDRARWLPGGLLEFAGRRDNQVKINGIRAELGEIETRLAEHPCVLQAAVVPPENNVLTAYVVWAGDQEGAAAELRAFCANRLPAAMVPGRYTFLDEIPLLSNGKADRAALPAADTPAFQPPRDLVESRLEALWEEILELPAIGIRDDFFALGGHSLRALRLVMRLRKEFGRDVPVETLMTHPTIEELATLLRSPSQLAPATAVVPLRSQGSRPPVWFVHALGGQVFRYRKLATLLGEDQPAYGLPARGFASGENKLDTVDAMAADYAARIRATTPDQPVVLAGFCVGGNLALEVARRLRSSGMAVPLVAVFWSQAVDAVSPELADDTRLMLSALAGAPIGIDHETLAALPPRERLAAIVEGANQAGALDPAATDLAQAERMLRIFRANATALRGHTHAPYDGDLVLLKPVQDSENPFGPTHGWEAVVTGKLEVVTVPGSRYDTAEEPHVRGTATVLKEVLDRVDGGH